MRLGLRDEFKPLHETNSKELKNTGWVWGQGLINRGFDHLDMHKFFIAKMDLGPGG